MRGPGNRPYEPMLRRVKYGATEVRSAICWIGRRRWRSSRRATTPARVFSPDSASSCYDVKERAFWYVVRGRRRWFYKSKAEMGEEKTESPCEGKRAKGSIEITIVVRLKTTKMSEEIGFRLSALKNEVLLYQLYLMLQFSRNI
ncbi:unnamed protein product [Cuscuta europaea]|uniref:Uncharacterized protein n=1 Tax=Cuscuta europaea TaxID=41803 RepID=A0A9P1EBS9_CUSEU|nr:unnamed protein product [Cuscuta europaea]